MHAPPPPLRRAHFSDYHIFCQLNLCLKINPSASVHSFSSLSFLNSLSMDVAKIETMEA
jgi:hypothetical protein